MTGAGAVRSRSSDRLGGALVAIALVASVVGSLGAPLITSVADDTGVSLTAAQWTLTLPLVTGAVVGPVLGRLGAGRHRRATVLAALAAVVVGGALATAPLPFWALLVGRGLQGVGVGVVALLMSVARDRMPAERSASIVAMLSVASTVGIGVGYPLIGLIDQLAGLRAAYGAGLLLSLAALALAGRVLPRDTERPAVRVDLPGAVLLGIGILGVLLAIADPELWRTPALGVAVLAVAAVALAGWAAVERRVRSPLVDLRVLARAGALRANLGLLVAGVAMYLLFGLLVRLVQTPTTAGYGFGLPGVLAGAALVPFSVLGFVAGRAAPRVVRRTSVRASFVLASASVALAAAVLALLPGSLVAVLVAMGLLGLGVGGVSAAMPSLVLEGAPREEASSVLSINQLVRSVGFGVGSALTGLLLALATPSGRVFPAAWGFPVAALVAIPLLAVSVAVVAIPGRRPHPAVE